MQCGYSPSAHSLLSAFYGAIVQNHIILSVLSHDKPGVVSAIANVVTECGGNWQESRLSRLGGKFAGVIAVVIDADHLAPLRESLIGLSQQGIQVVLDVNQAPPQLCGLCLRFHAAAPDRKGIVREMSNALAHHHINVLELTTECSSMPYSGDPLFSASGLIALPPSLSIDAANDVFDAISGELGIDFELQPEGLEE